MGQIKFSVLVSTLEDRKGLLDKLVDFLLGQAQSYDLFDEFEILMESDKGEKTTGEKRNDLLQRAEGDFVAFVDDDDWVSDTYVPDIINTIKKVPELDCIGFYGNVYFDRDKLAGKMIHSIACPAWTEDGTAYYRPPNHLNPVRRNIAAAIKFRPIRISEDHFWSRDLQATGRLKHEVFLGAKPTYFYHCGVERKQL